MVIEKKTYDSNRNETRWNDLEYHLLTRNSSKESDVEVKKKCSCSCDEICCSLILFVFGVIFTIIGIFFIKYSLKEIMMNDMLNIRPSLPPFQQWANPIPEVLVKMYLFNATNYREFSEGEDEQLHLEEIGPVTYREITKHTDVVFHENSTLSYTVTKHLEYAEDYNIPGILNWTIVTPNLITLGMASKLKDAGYFVNLGVKLLMSQQGEEAFKNITIYDYLWNFKTNFFSLVQKIVGTSVIPSDNVGGLYAVYKNYSHRVNVNIGLENGPEKFFTINSFDDSQIVPGFDLSKGDCNASFVGGTEGVLFPQGLTKDTVITLWRNSVCRTIKFYFEEEVQKGSMLAYKFSLPNDAFDRFEPKEADCFKGDEKKPLPNGLTDVSKCSNGVPFALSKPHFYGREGEWTKRISGLKPQKEHHDSYAIIEPKMGVSMEQRARVMNNLIISDDISSVYPYAYQRFRGMVLPMGWIEIEQKDLTPFIDGLIYIGAKVLPAIDGPVGAVFLVLGLILLVIFSIRIVVKCRKNK